MRIYLCSNCWCCIYWHYNLRCSFHGFIWIRQKNAAWEGYFLQPGTAEFITIFVLGLAALQTLSFASELFSPTGAGGFFGAIANTAHISGALIGMALGRLSFFEWKGNSFR